MAALAARISCSTMNRLMARSIASAPMNASPVSVQRPIR